MDDLTFRTEPVTALLDEIKPLLEEHYQEIARHRDKIALNPNYEKYMEMDRLGMVHAVTIRERDGGKLVGYFISFVFPHIHYKDHLMAFNDIVYIAPEFRRSWTAAKMFRFAEETLKARGVTKIHVNVKLAHDFGLLLERLGFVEIERIYEKMLI